MATATSRSTAEVGEILKAARLKRGLSQEALAKRARIGARTLIRIEQGYPALMSTVIALCEALEMPVGEVFDA